MKQTLLAVSFALALLTPGPALMAQTSHAGHWEGNVILPEQELTISVDLAKSDKGVWTGSLGVPSQGASGLKIEKIEIDGKNVKFTVPEAPGSPSFSGSLKDDGHLALTLAVNGGSFPADLKRTGEAKVAEVLPSPALEPRFEGTWEGSLESPTATLHVIFHFQNQPDKTVKATIDSPDQNALGLRLDGVVQKGGVIELQFKIAGGAYKGTLNAAGTELTGEWTQGGETLPLKLKKAAK